MLSYSQLDMDTKEASVYELPTCDMFTCTREVVPPFYHEVAIQNSIIDISKSYGVEVTPADIYQSTWKTRYEFYLGRGTSVKKCKQLEKELATHIGALALKIVAPVPGRQTIAVDILKEKPEETRIGDGLKAYSRISPDGNASLLLGIDAEYNAVTVKLSDNSNVLIHGTTGTGKSICMQGMLMSLLLKHSPSELSLVLAAKQAATFTHYRKLPHLYRPVIKSSNELQITLRELITEINRRLELFQKYNVNTLAEFNAHVKGKIAENQEEEGLLQIDNSQGDIGKRIDVQYHRIRTLLRKVTEVNDSITPLPQIVMMVDDIESLMPISDSHVFHLLQQVLHYGSSAGINTVLSIQNLSTLRNYPETMALMNNRVGFHTRNRTEAQYFLGDYGAEALPPYGACLFAAKGEQIKAVDTCMVHATDNIIMSSHWSQYTHTPPSIKDKPVQKGIPSSRSTLDEYEEEVYQRCVELVATERKASTSLLQRRLSIGYGQAAKLLDIMEERGVVSPPQGAVRARVVLI